jgi:hypothetical protein
MKSPDIIVMTALRPENNRWETNYTDLSPDGSGILLLCSAKDTAYSGTGYFSSAVPVLQKIRPAF